MSLIQRIWNKVSGAGHKGKVRASFSQSGEDMIIDYIFTVIGVEKPSYIDIGAHHPYRMSNTAYFYGKGCRGINIEPDPVLFEAFRAERKEDINLNIGIAGEAATLNFHRLSAPTLNTFSKEEAERMCAEHGYTIREVIPVQVMDLQSVLDRHFGGKFPQFLSVDVEGLDEVILRSIDYKQNFPIVICVETISFETDGSGVKNQPLIDFLLSNGYQLYADTYINSIFVRSAAWNRK